MRESLSREAWLDRKFEGAARRWHAADLESRPARPRSVPKSSDAVTSRNSIGKTRFVQGF